LMAEKARSLVRVAVCDVLLADAVAGCGAIFADAFCSHRAPRASGAAGSVRRSVEGIELL
jgi:hypothetical protein